MRGTSVGVRVLGKAGYLAACLAAAVVLVAGAYAHGLTSGLDALEGGASLGGNVSPASAQNILLMGLESRTNFQGQTLSKAQLAATHAGSIDGDLGAQDTDTLILIHVDAGGQRAVGFSIPRDDVVNYPYAMGGVTEGKIDGAYDVAYNTYVSQNIGRLGNTPALYTGANQAGQLFETQTVESVTGVHVDNFVVSNIIGFYSIASLLGGINVCLAPAPASIEPAGEGFVTGSNLIDLPFEGANFKLQSNSGFDAFNDGYNVKKGGAQYIHLQPAQALAFVRARDSLPGVDIGRTARQQAAIDYIIYDLKHRNVLTDPGTISQMLSAASSFLQVNQGFNLLDFAPQMRSLTGQHLKLSTLADAAVTGIDIPGLGANQDANYIYVPNLQQTVNDAFYGSAAVKATKSVTVDVFNGSGTAGLAGEVSQAFAADGYSVGQAANSSSQSQPMQAGTQVFYGAGAQSNADSIAAMVGDSGGAASLSSLPAGHVEVLLGSQVTDLPAGLETFGASTVTEQDFMAAAQQDGLPASDLTPAISAATATTQSVSATEVGPRAAVPAQSAPAETSAAQSAAAQSSAARSEVGQLTAMMQLAAAAQSASSASGVATTASTYHGPRPADVPAGIPCVY